MPFHEILGLLAGILAFLPCPLYVYAILKGETKPDRVTWWVLALVSAMIVGTYQSVGAHETIWLPLGYTASFLIVAIFSLRYGDGPAHLNTLDRICLAGALVSIVVWQFLESPFLALLMNMVIEVIALTPTVVKAYTRPQTEDASAWVVTTAASILNLFAISLWTLDIALYPVYVFLTNAAIMYIIIRPRKKILTPLSL